MPTSLVYRFFLLILPPLLWIYGTKFTFYNFHYIKSISLFIILFSEWLLLLSILYQLLSRAFLPKILEFETDEIFTKNMIVLLGRITTQLPLLLAGYTLYKILIRFLSDESIRKTLFDFKLSHYDMKKSNKEFSYTMNIVKDIKTGRPITVTAKDRFLHTLVDGTSGTGKTSSTILPAVKDDLNLHCKTEDIQKELLKTMESEGKIVLVQNSGTFSINNFIPTVKTEEMTPEEIDCRLEEIKAELEKIRLTYPVCGLTVLAPDDSLADDVCRLCDVRSIPYNRIDPTRDRNGNIKKHSIGMNPFYLPQHIDPERKDQMIVKKAVIFSDVMQAITDLKGKADSYFSGLNRQMIANIAILVMMTVPILKRRQASPADLQELINNFDLLKEPVDTLEDLDEGRNQYTFIIQYIREDLLGKGRTKMEDQSRGTRNIINEFLLMPDNKKIFCSQNSIDFDRALENGEVTICNYNLAAGDTDALAFGLFFLLSFNNAVLSRPGTEHTRISHFFYVDELPVLIHPSLEKNFSLFRKFRVAMFVAIQTLDQFEKNEITKYLKGVILGCAHLIVFGRSSLSDMEIFSSFAGVRDYLDIQKTTSETALSGEDPKLSYSSREILTQKNAIEEIDIRMKDFQEVTFFTIKDGRPLPAVHGRVEFLKPADWKELSRLPVTFTENKPEHFHLDQSKYGKRTSGCAFEVLRFDARLLFLHKPYCRPSASLHCLHLFNITPFSCHTEVLTYK